MFGLNIAIPEVRQQKTETVQQVPVGMPDLVRQNLNIRQKQNENQNIDQVLPMNQTSKVYKKVPSSMKSLPFELSEITIYAENEAGKLLFLPPNIRVTSKGQNRFLVMEEWRKFDVVDRNLSQPAQSDRIVKVQLGVAVRSLLWVQTSKNALSLDDVSALLAGPGNYQDQLSAVYAKVEVLGITGSAEFTAAIPQAQQFTNGGGLGEYLSKAARLREFSWRCQVKPQVVAIDITALPSVSKSVAPAN